MKTPIINQRLFMIDWKKGEPYFKFGVVSRVTKKTFDVSFAGGIDKSLDYCLLGEVWHTDNWLGALDKEMVSLLGSIALGEEFRSWSVKKKVSCINRLWRLRSKCIKKLGVKKK